MSERVITLNHQATNVLDEIASSFGAKSRAHAMRKVLALARIAAKLQRPDGSILMETPAGSGKYTSVYLRDPTPTSPSPRPTGKPKLRIISGGKK